MCFCSVLMLHIKDEPDGKDNPSASEGLSTLQMF